MGKIRSNKELVKRVIYPNKFIPLSTFKSDIVLSVLFDRKLKVRYFSKKGIEKPLKDKKRMYVVVQFCRGITIHKQNGPMNFRTILDHDDNAYVEYKIKLDDFIDMIRCQLFEETRIPRYYITEDIDKQRITNVISCFRAVRISFENRMGVEDKSIEIILDM